MKNKDNKRKLENVNVSVPGTNIGTVTNADGVFLSLIHISGPD